VPPEMPGRPAITRGNTVQDRCAGAHRVEEAQRISCQPFVEPGPDLEGVADLCTSLNSKADSRDVEHAEVHDMNVEARRGLWSYRPDL
jgi:hypothetical protein